MDFDDMLNLASSCFVLLCITIYGVISFISSGSRDNTSSLNLCSELTLSSDIDYFINFGVDLKLLKFGVDFKLAFTVLFPAGKKKF